MWSDLMGDQPIVDHSDGRHRSGAAIFESGVVNCERQAPKNKIRSYGQAVVKMEDLQGIRVSCQRLQLPVMAQLRIPH